MYLFKVCKFKISYPWYVVTNLILIRWILNLVNFWGVTNELTKSRKPPLHINKSTTFFQYQNMCKPPLIKSILFLPTFESDQIIDIRKSVWPDKEKRHISRINMVFKVTQFNATNLNAFIYIRFQFHSSLAQRQTYSNIWNSSVSRYVDWKIW